MRVTCRLREPVDFGLRGFLLDGGLITLERGDFDALTPPARASASQRSASTLLFATVASRALRM